MKQLLLAACAVLALLGSVHAASLPSHMVDGWCREDQVKSPEAEYPLLSTYYRVSPEIKCDDKMDIKHDGIQFNKEDWCSIKKVQQRTVRTWLVYASCHAAGSPKSASVKMVLESWAGNNILTLWEKE